MNLNIKNQRTIRRLKIVLILFLFFFLPYNLVSQTQDIEFKNSSAQKSSIGIIQAIEFSTLGYESGLYTVTATSSGSNSKYAIRLKYRVNNKKWENASDTRGRKIEHHNYKKRKSSTYKVILGEDALDQEKVELGWELIRIGKKGKTPSFSFSNIKLNGDYDNYKDIEPEIELFVKNGDNYNRLENKKLEFNHIPFPFTFPQTKRIWIRAKYLRDDIILDFNSKDSIHFTVDTRNFLIDSIDEKIISISYSPKSIGKHSTQLILSTRKLKSNINIDLSGSSDIRKDFSINFFENNINSLKHSSNYRFPIFSKMEYQFKFEYEKKELGNKEISFRYRWYKDDNLLLEMKDNLNNLKSNNIKKYKNEADKYCVPLNSPENANNIEIIIDSKGGSLKVDNLYFGTPVLKYLIASGNWSEDNIWSPKGSPSVEDFVYISPNLKIKVDEDAYCSTLILGDSSNVEIEINKMFYVSGDIYYGKKSWFIVHQDLNANKWTYTSSPVDDTKALIFSMRKNDNEAWLMEYNTGIKSKLNDYWSDYIIDPNHKILPGKGYAVFSKQTLDVIYEGILNNSQVRYPLVYSEKDSWNLVGNPYTAPLSSKKLYGDIDGKIQGNVIFLFDSKNNVYNPIIIDDKEEVVIPSLQGFFVEALKTNSEMIFKRSQQYIPKSSSYSWTNHNYLTLNVTNGEKEEYIIMGMRDDAFYGFDKYDAHKLFGSSKDTPEIYFLKDGEELSVNVFPSYPAIYDLGVYVGKESSLDLSLGNLSILPENIQIIIHDKKNNKYTSLCNNNSFSFSVNSGSNDDRFRVLLLKGINIPELEGENSGIYIWNDEDNVNIFSDNYHNLGGIRVWDKSNNFIYEQEYTQGFNVLDYKFEKGVYNLELEIGDNWIKGFIIEIE